MNSDKAAIVWSTGAPALTKMMMDLGFWMERTKSLGLYWPERGRWPSRSARSTVSSTLEVVRLKTEIGKPFSAMFRAKF